MSAATLKQAACVVLKTAVDDDCLPEATGHGLLITPRACSLQLLGDAELYELASMRGTMPDVLLAELLAAQRLLTDAYRRSSARQRIDALLVDQRCDVPGLLAASQQRTGDRGMPSAAEGLDSATWLAAAHLTRLVRLLGCMPPLYFATPLAQQLLAQLLRTEQLLLCVAAVAADQPSRLACEAVLAVRTSFASLLAGAAELTAQWAGTEPVTWFLSSLDVLSALAGNALEGHAAQGSLPEVEAAARQTGVLLAQLLQNHAARVQSCGNGSEVDAMLAAVHLFCGNLAAIAASSSPATHSAKPADAFVPRTVALQQLPKSKARLADNVQNAGSPDASLCAQGAQHFLRTLARAVIANAVFTALVKDAARAQPPAWRALRQQLVTALHALEADTHAAAPPMTLALLGPLFGALAATVELELLASDPGEAVSAADLRSMHTVLRMACNVLVSGAPHQAELLRFVAAVLRLLRLQGELSTGLCGSMLAVFSNLLQGVHASPTRARDAELRLQTAVLDAFSALVSTAEAEQQECLVDALARATQDPPSQVAGVADWGALEGTLRLMASLARLLPKPTVTGAGERCLAAAVAACALVGRDDGALGHRRREDAASAAVCTPCCALLLTATLD